jgi:ElaA protein
MIAWDWGRLHELSSADLYEALRARQDVFILEQRCLYPDLDGYDLEAHHLLGWITVQGERTLAAYLRCLAPGTKYAEASLGRVLTTQAARGTGAGRLLVVEGVRRLQSLYPGQPIRIGAQAHLQAFYGEAGFRTVSDPYDEDGIAHVEMLRASSPG